LWQKLSDIDPESGERIDPADRRRIVRALEVFELTSVTMTEHQRTHDFRTAKRRYPARLIGLEPAREDLYERISDRVDQMMDSGLLDEVRALRSQGYGPELRSQQAIGYSELHHHLDGEGDLSEAVRLIKRNSRRYARRQLSWYRGDPSVEWHPHPMKVDLEGHGRYLRGLSETP
jgi:tRNA dimethylallyltransferase